MSFWSIARMQRVALATALVALSLPAAAADATARGTNGRIAFHRDSHIWLVTPQGLLPTQVTSSDDNLAYHYDPGCAPDGGQIAFITPVGTSNGAVAVIDTATQNLHYVFGQQHAASQPAWSPDKKKIAFSLFVNGYASEIMVADADGVNQATPLTGVIDPNSGNYIDGINIQPEWSPDGKKIAFASSRDGDYDIYTVNVATGTIKQLTNNPGPDVDPTWAPGGARIAFTRFSSGNSDIWVMRSDGSGQVNITGSSPATEHQPTWSPDGQKIAFTRGNGSQAQIFKMSTDGTAVKVITGGDSPSWCGLGPI